MKPTTHRRWRQLRASLRDTLLLLREFGWPLLFFNLTLLGGGGLYYLIAQRVQEPVGDLSATVYHILTLVFLNPVNAYPRHWALRAFYFLMPLLGIGLLAQGIADFGTLFFNRRARGKEWEMAVARELSQQFGFKAISNSATASPLFAAAAAGVDMTYPLVIEGRALSLARLQVEPRSQLARLTVEEIEQRFNVSVVLLRRAAQQADYHPPAAMQVRPGDVLAILGEAEQISHVVNHNLGSG